MSIFKRVWDALRKHYPLWVYSTATYWTTRSGTLVESQDNHDGELRVESDPYEGLLMGSLIDSEDEEPKYRLLLDLDHRAVLLPSSSKDHSHLIVDVELTKHAHDKVMLALSDAGIVQRGFALGGADHESGTTLRLPWVKKGDDWSLKQQQQRSAKDFTCKIKWVYRSADKYSCDIAGGF